ncbi:right-handed parallel beta-helix repeat-containing protein [Sphingomonas immobilis]|uniref:Right-handed parallel beta-helix repeat-containing protein n=1 Tax=Sphingomonas immobilis TaxID=3063997 RepID=A0ABT9A3N5_9SPHN|nr:right-handed parallel beta-helix repeat-containing protein [Sphingomonas sp. CA1-15]MDO7844455.1 right-handed parallel beta-helix repeat-containing protein [Sphingomonas sp. CA1-15]
MRRLLSIALLALAAPVAAQSGGGPFTVQETGQSFGTLQDALMSIRGQDATILIAPGTYRQCAIQQAGHIVFKPSGAPGSVIFEGTACEDKAVLVLRGKASTVDGLIFRGIRVGDGNGAGVRIETGDLTVRNSMFLDSQEGILGGAGEAMRIAIDHTTFSGLGQCDESPSCAHSIYLESKGPVTVTNSRFERGRGGHYIKVRGPRVSIVSNSFDDTAGTKTNYMIDLPNGATGTIQGNTFVQGRNKENWTGFVVVAAEVRENSAAGLRVEGNTASLAPGETRSPAFVADYSHERLAIGANSLGKGIRPFETR